MPAAGVAGLRGDPSRLFVLRAGALGDFVLGIPALRALRRRFPAAEITVAAPLPQAHIALWANLADRVVGFDDPALARVIAATAADWPPVAPRPDAAVVWLRGHAAVQEVLRRAGVAATAGAAPLDAIVHRVHAATWLERSLRPFGIEEQTAARTALRPPAAAPSAPRRYIVLHPGSGSARKNWSGWAAVAGALPPLEVVVPAGPADAAPVRALLDGWPEVRRPPRVIDEPSLERLAAWLAGAALYLGNDSGVSHLAAAVGAPSVVAFGPTDPEIWRPVGPHAVALGGTRVEAGIFAPEPRWPAVAQVTAAARRLLAQAV